MKKFLEQKKSAIVSGMSNNKGFSLVELIIVVAIMAVLMGVLAPQYLRFVETSRIQADQSAFNEVMKVMTIATAAMPKMPLEVSVTWDNATGTLFVNNGYTAAPTAGVDGTGTSLADGMYNELKLTLGTAMNIGAPTSTRYNTTVSSTTAGLGQDHMLVVGVDSSGVPFIWTPSTAWSFALGLPNVSTGGSAVAVDPVTTAP